MQKLTINQIAHITSGKILNPDPQLDTPLPIVHDTRLITESCVFAAIQGETHDGHLFLKPAYEKGAQACLVSNSKKATDFQGVCIRVKDTVTALGDIASHIRKRSRILWIGITGSAGKTTTRNLLASILRKTGKVLCPIRNFNNLIGVPLTILNLDDSHNYAVMELGTNSPGEIPRLADIVRPDIAIITNTGPSHTEFLGSIEGVAEEKSAILKNLSPDKTAVLNHDDPFMDTYREKSPAPVVTFGNEQSDFFATHINDQGDRVCFTLNHQLECEIPGTGYHLALDACAAVAAARQIGISMTDCIKGISAFIPEDMRMERVTANGVFIYNDCYNSNPLSLRNALRTIAAAGNGRKIAVLGDMLELGTLSDLEHENAIHMLSEFEVDKAYLLGKCMKQAYKRTQKKYTQAIVLCDSKKDLISRLSEFIQSDDTILIKASRGMRFDDIFNELTNRS